MNTDVAATSSPTHNQIIRGLDKLAMSADAKALLSQIAEISATVGGQLIYMGRRIIGFILDLIRCFPNTAFGLIAAFVVATLVSSVPLIGALIGPLLTPLLLALGVAQGSFADIQRGDIADRVKHFIDGLGLGAASA